MKKKITVWAILIKSKTLSLEFADYFSDDTMSNTDAASIYETEDDAKGALRRSSNPGQYRIVKCDLIPKAI